MVSPFMGRIIRPAGNRLVTLCYRRTGGNRNALGGAVGTKTHEVAARLTCAPGMGRRILQAQPAAMATGGHGKRGIEARAVILNPNDRV
jgi:hypothetical protein